MRISNVFCTDTSECVYIQVDTGKVSISSSQSVLSPKIYQNPASTLVHIEGKAHETIIYNTLGQQVLVSREKDIDVSKLDVGVYYIMITAKTGDVWKREKLIIQR